MFFEQDMAGQLSSVLEDFRFMATTSGILRRCLIKCLMLSFVYKLDTSTMSEMILRQRSSVNENIALIRPQALLFKPPGRCVMLPYIKIYILDNITYIYCVPCISAFCTDILWGPIALTISICCAWLSILAEHHKILFFCHRLAFT